MAMTYRDYQNQQNNLQPWGHPGLAKTKQGYILGFPSSETRKRYRMDKLMRWKIQQMNDRRWRQIVWWTVFFVSLPIAIALYVELWKLAVWVVGGAW
jgi:hypothetical protein